MSYCPIVPVRKLKSKVYYLDTLRVRTEDDVIHVRAEGTVPRDKVDGIPARLDLFRHVLEEKAGEPVILEIEAIPVDIVLFRSATDGDKDQGAPLTPAIGE